VNEIRAFADYYNAGGNRMPRAVIAWLAVSAMFIIVLLGYVSWIAGVKTNVLCLVFLAGTIVEMIRCRARPGIAVAGLLALAFTAGIATWVVSALS
jgi:hypothetical protein